MKVRTPVFEKSEGRLTPELSRRPAVALVARGLLVGIVAVGAVLAEPPRPSKNRDRRGEPDLQPP